MANTQWLQKENFGKSWQKRILLEVDAKVGDEQRISFIDGEEVIGRAPACVQSSTAERW